jgi:hypothetical protein
MKKLLVIIFASLVLATALPLYLVYAGFGQEGAFINVKARLEVSKDNVNWVNYEAEDDSGSGTLTVSPGDTIYFRLKTWNTGTHSVANVAYAAAFTNQQYLIDSVMFTGSGGGSGDLGDDGDPANGYSMTGEGYNSETGIATFELSGVAADSTITSGYQSGGITSQIATGTPDQTIITAAVTISDAVDLEIGWLNNIVSRAYADEFGTTTIGIIVSNPAVANNTADQSIVQTLPATGPNSADI